MKIEVCEHAIAAWLTHVKGCQIVQINWKPSPLATYSQEDMKDIEGFVEEIRKFSAEKGLDILKKSTLSQMVQQCEIDVAGVRLEEGIVGNLYLVDSAFHENGLNYNDTVARVLKKIVRALFVAGVVFKDIPAEVIFASPKCGRESERKLREELKELDGIIHNFYPDSKITLLFNFDFAAEVYAPLIENIDRFGDDNDLFLRSVKLSRLSEDILGGGAGVRGRRSAVRQNIAEAFGVGTDYGTESEPADESAIGTAAGSAAGPAADFGTGVGTGAGGKTDVPAYPAESGRKTIWIDGRPYGYTDLGESGKGAKPRREREKMSYIGVYTPRNNNQAFVFGVLHGLLNRGMLDEKTVQDLCSPAWCKRVLQMHSLFPMLLPVSRLAASGYESVRFYKKERLEVGGKEYLVCSQWYPDNIRALKKWYDEKLGG